MINFTLSFLGIIFLSLIIRPPVGDFLYINSLIGIIIGPIYYFLIAHWIGEFSIQSLRKIINVVIFIHLIFFLLQFIWYIFSGDVLDFLSPVTGENSRNLNNMGFIRASGLFNEPMVYSFFMFTLLLIKHLILRAKHDLMEVIVLTTIILSFSSWGIVSVVFYVLSSVRFNLKNYTFLFVLVTLIVFLFFYFDLNSYYEFIFENRFSNLTEDSSFEYRYAITYDIFIHDIGMLVFGNGLAVPGKNGILDLSLLLQIFTSLGLFMGSLFLCLIFIRLLFLNRGLNFIVLFLLLTMGDLRIQQLFFWFLLAFFLQNHEHKEYMHVE